MKVPISKREEGQAAPGGWSADVAPLVARVVRELREGVEDLVSLMLRDMREQLPAAGAVSSTDPDAVERTLRAALRVWLELLADGREVSAAEVGFLEGAGAREAGQGIPLEEVLASVRPWISRAWNNIAGRIAEQPPAPATAQSLNEVGAWLIALERTALDAIARGHRGESPAPASENLTRRFVADLLAGSLVSAEDAVAAGASLGRDLTVPHGLLLIIPHGDGRARCLDRARADLVARLPSSLAGPANDVPRTHAVLVVPAASEKDWDAVLEAAAEVGTAHTVTVLAAQPVARPQAIHAAFLSVARLVVLTDAAPRRPVITSDDLFVHRNLAALPPDLLDELERRIVDPLLILCDQDRYRLVETLHAYYERHFNVLSTSKAMRITRQAVTDRLEKVERITRLSVRRHRHQFELALHHPALIASANLSHSECAN